jgi:hypothetical protein
MSVDTASVGASQRPAKKIGVKNPKLKQPTLGRRRRRQEPREGCAQARVEAKQWGKKNPVIRAEEAPQKKERSGSSLRGDQLIDKSAITGEVSCKAGGEFVP